MPPVSRSSPCRRTGAAPPVRSRAIFGLAPPTRGAAQPRTELPSVSNTTPPPKADVVLVWLPAGDTPTEESFDLENLQPPPVPNPEEWRTLQEAIKHAVETMPYATHAKEPWIKAGETLLDPDEISRRYKDFKRNPGTTEP